MMPRGFGGSSPVWEIRVRMRIPNVGWDVFTKEIYAPWMTWPTRILCVDGFRKAIYRIARTCRPMLRVYS